jgi:hypothetical protein
MHLGERGEVWVSFIWLWIQNGHGKCEHGAERFGSLNEEEFLD